MMIVHTVYSCKMTSFSTSCTFFSDSSFQILELSFTIRYNRDYFFLIVGSIRICQVQKEAKIYGLERQLTADTLVLEVMYFRSHQLLALKHMLYLQVM